MGGSGMPRGVAGWGREEEEEAVGKEGRGGGRWG